LASTGSDPGARNFMTSDDISFDLIVQALIIFEGLSLWKFANLFKYSRHATALGVEQMWKSARQKDKCPELDLRKIHQFEKLSKRAEFCSRFASRLIWTPYLVGVLVPILILLTATGIIPNHCILRGIFTWIALVFILFKLSSLLLALKYNSDYWKKIRQDNPNIDNLSSETLKVAPNQDIS